MTFNVGLVKGNLEAVVDKLGEVQKKSGNPPVERPRVGARRRRSPAGECRGSAYEDAGSGRAVDARLQAFQVAICAGARLRGPLGGGGSARRRDGSARRRSGSARHRVASRLRAVGSPPVGPLFS